MRSIGGRIVLQVELKMRVTLPILPKSLIVVILGGDLSGQHFDAGAEDQVGHLHHLVDDELVVRAGEQVQAAVAPHGQHEASGHISH